MDEVFLGQARTVSPVSSVFTYGPRDSPVKGDYQLNREFLMPRMLGSQLSYAESERDSVFSDKAAVRNDGEVTGRSSVASLRAASPVKLQKASYRPRSAISSRTPASPVSSSKRPRSASTYQGLTSSQYYYKYQRSSSRGTTASEEGVLPHPSRGSTPTPGTPLASRTAGQVWDLESHMPQSPRVEIQYRAQNVRHSAVTSPVSKEGFSCRASRSDPSVCPPNCVCQLPPAERDAALMKKRKISFREEGSVPQEGSSERCARLSSSGSAGQHGHAGSDLGQLSGWTGSCVTLFNSEVDEVRLEVTTDVTASLTQR